MRRASTAAATTFGLAASLIVTGVHAAGAARISVDSPAVDEGVATLSFTLTRTGETASTVTVRVDTEDNTAVAPADYTAVASTPVTLAAGQASATLGVAVAGDSVDENDESLFLHLTGVLDVTGPPASYAAASSLAQGGGPRAIAAVDLNGDGLSDLVTANQDDGTVSVRLNTASPGAGTPSHAAAGSFAVGAAPSALTALDIDGDGRMDLAVANEGSGGVSALLNTTAAGAAVASFAAASHFASGNNPRGIAAADFNGDGLADLAVANHGSDKVSILLGATAPGASTASFAAATSFGVGAGPVAVSVLDVNGDGRPDLAVANDEEDTVSVLINTTAPGSGAVSLAAALDFAAGNEPRAVASLEVNGDGRTDLAVASAASANVLVLLNTTAAGAAAPSFAAASAFAAGAARALAAHDLNGDGRQDLVVGTASDGVRVLVNTTRPGAAAASYAAASPHAAGTGAQSVVAADVNQDGRPDLAAADPANGKVHLLLNSLAAPSASLALAQASSFSVHADPAEDTGPVAVLGADVNGDGRRDVVTANSDGVSVSVLLNAAAPGAAVPTFATPGTFPVGGMAKSVTATDVNGDGMPDLAVVKSDANAVTVLLNTMAPGAAAPGFGAARHFAVGPAPHGVVATDVNGDGRPDLAVANLGFGGSNVSVLINTTAPGATEASYATASHFTAASGAQALASADFNGDGRPDLATANFNTNDVSVLLNTTAPGAATPSFASAAHFAVGSLPVSITAADLNGDGRADLAAANFGGNTVSVLLNTAAPGAATPGFAAATHFFTVGNEPSSVTTADLQGDGRRDLVLTNHGSGTLSVLFNTTAAGAALPAFAEAENFSIGGKPFGVAAADLNGDGRADLVSANSATFSNTVSVLLGRGAVFTVSKGTGTIRDDDSPGSDATPAAFSFADQGGVEPATVVTSAPVTITGIDTAATVGISGGEYSVGCGGTYTAAAGSVGNGQTICVRHTSAAEPGGSRHTVLTVGGVSDTFTTTTRAAPGDTPAPAARAGGALDGLGLLLLGALPALRRRRAAGTARLSP